MAGEQQKDEKEKPKEKPKEKEKKKRPQQPFPWDLSSFPKREDRPVVQAELAAEKLAELRERAQRRVRAAMGADPATLTRRWQVSISVTGIENTTAEDWNVILTTTQRDNKDKPGKGKKQGQSQSYTVPKNERKVLKTPQTLMQKTWDGSYQNLKRQELQVEVHLVNGRGFNKPYGTCRKSLYDMGDESVSQTMLVTPIEKGSGSYGIGILYINAVVSEVFKFTIVASNWTFQPHANLHDYTANKKLRITIPTGTSQEPDTFQTQECPGPRYCWQKCGQFTYQGTMVALSMEAAHIAVYTAGQLQGKTVVSLGLAGEYPIAMGTVKALSQNKNLFVQGRVGGSISVMSKSLLLKDSDRDDNPSIPAPRQPPNSLVVFQLSPKLQYLIVDMFSAEGLPIADTDYGSSNPMVRVKFDSMVQQSTIVYGTLNPTWGHRFYLPVRVTDERLRTVQQYYEQLLPLEMASKGYLEFEVWHVDAVPTEFLGSYKLDLHSLLYCKAAQKAIVDKIAKTEKDGGDALGIPPGLATRHQTKVYEGRREKLGGSWLQSATRSTISFDAYFVPDMPKDFKYPKQVEKSDDKDPFERSYAAWDKAWPDFQNAYTAWFPDAQAERRFVSRYTDSGGQNSPLPRLITALALPASLANPLKVQHWVKCTEFETPPRQRCAGEIHTWLRPEDVLALRRGAVQDHAVLLCCALLGLGKNAFVCKGTVQGGKDHCWVMTRESTNGTVTFWETTTAAKYHMMFRWIGDHSHGDNCKKIVQERWANRKFLQEWDKEHIVAKRQGLNRQQQLQYMDDLQRLPISPWRDLCREDNVVVLPYESIEVVFNHHQLWGNKSNHHPACIYYDMEDDHQSWLPLVHEEQLATLGQNKEVAIPVGPALAQATARELEVSIQEEVKESVRMSRMRHGHETHFEDSEVLQATLEQYLSLLETECYLESDWAYTPPPECKALSFWGHPSPFNSVVYKTSCQDQWSGYWKRKAALTNARKFLPVKENHVLSGIPLHFSTTDIKAIRKSLMAFTPAQEYYSLPMDEAAFFIIVKVFPMPSSVASVWMFFGAELPLPAEKVAELAEANMQKMFQEPAMGESDEEDQGEPQKQKKKKKGAWGGKAEDFA